MRLWKFWNSEPWGSFMRFTVSEYFYELFMSNIYNIPITFIFYLYNTFSLSNKKPQKSLTYSVELSRTFIVCYHFLISIFSSIKPLSLIISYQLLSFTWSACQNFPINLTKKLFNLSEKCDFPLFFFFDRSLVTLGIVKSKGKMMGSFKVFNVFLRFFFWGKRGLRFYVKTA